MAAPRTPRPRPPTRRGGSASQAPAAAAVVESDLESDLEPELERERDRDESEGDGDAEAAELLAPGEAPHEDAGLALRDDPDLPALETPPGRRGRDRDERHLARVERDPVQRFLAEARRFARLSEEEERRLIAEYREKGDREAARTLVVHNLRLVVSIAYQYRQAWTNILDLFQEGSVGLMEAVKRWDPALGTRFGSYAADWIRAFILKFLMTNARLIHVGNTRAGRKLFFRLERERQKLLAAGYDPTPKLLASKLAVDE